MGDGSEMNYNGCGKVIFSQACVRLQGGWVGMPGPRSSPGGGSMPGQKSLKGVGMSREWILTPPGH